MSVTLHGFPFSTYTWSARLALAEKGVDYTLQPARLGSPEHARLHPWHKMPALEHDGWRVFETVAIMRYVDEAFEGPALQPADVRGRARVAQWMSAFNDFVAPAAVRGVLIPRFVWAPRGRSVDDARVAAKAAASRSALAVFEDALSDAPYLVGVAPTLADWLLLPVVVSGARLVGADRYTDELPRLAAWTERMTARPSFGATAPG